MRRMALSAALLAAFAVSAPSAAQNNYQPPVFTVHPLKFDAYRAACGLDCLLRTRSAQDLLVSVSSFMGIDPIYLKLALGQVSPPPHLDGESTYYTVPIPAGEAYCSSHIWISSILSSSADPARASKVWANIEKDKVWVETWTGKPRPGEGQSSVEGTLHVFTARPQDLAQLQSQGLCNPPPQISRRQLLYCQGNPCPPREDTPLERAGSLMTTPMGSPKPLP